MSLEMLKNLEFELNYQKRDLVRREGGAVLAYTDKGRRLMKNLEAIQALKAKKAA